MTGSPLKVEREGAVVMLTLCAPERLEAMLVAGS
jgi:hypothetical protein